METADAADAGVSMNLIVEIQELGYRGVGIGRVEGKVVMVPLTAPGDRAEVRIVRTHRSYDEARLVRLPTPSPFRREPPCPYFGRCGGCQLQHLDISHQRYLKAKLFMQTVTHQGCAPSERVGEILATPQELEYRSRIEMHVCWTPRPELGFMRLGSSKVIPVEKCLVAMPPLHPLLHGARALLQASKAHGPERVELSCDADGNGAFITLTTAQPLGARAREAIIGSARELPGLRGVYVHHGQWDKVLPLWEQGTGPRGVLYGVPRTLGSEDPLLEAWPGVFSQVNPAVNRLLLTTAMAWVRESTLGRILDLYCGMGNLTLPLASLAQEVVAVEINPAAVENARVNADRLGIRNIRWIHGAAAQGVKELSAAGERFDLVLLDPPRTGAREILDGLLSLAPDALLYVSCEPPTLARDLRYLQQAGCYEVARTQPLDMFPQTFHLESLTLLRRISGLK